MKHLLIVTFLLLSVAVHAQSESTLTWHTNLEEAQDIAKKDGKVVLLYFTGSDWCAPCKMLKEDFWHSDRFAQMADQFVLVELDEPRRVDIITPEQRVYNRKLGREYNQKGSFPNIVALDKRGRVIDEISGYTMLRETDTHFAFLDRLLQKNY